MAKGSIVFVKGVLLSLLVSGLASCEAFNSLTSNSASPDASSTATSPAADASPPGTAPSGSTKAVAGQNVTCDTSNYRGEITWQGEQARMTFGRKPNETNVREASPVAILSNADGSTTYGYQGELTVYLRAYPDGSCLLQALSRQGAVTVEEFGRTGFINQVSRGGTLAPAAPATPATPATSAAPASLATMPLANPASAAELPIDPSSSAKSLLTCVGTIKDSVDFTAFFAPQAGFHRVVFRPRESKVAVVSALSYKGKNSQGQETWQGKANEVASVTLAQLSSSTPQRGTQISVDYDGLVGQAVCQ